MQTSILRQIEPFVVTDLNLKFHLAAVNISVFEILL